jgi:hypothetical protein
MRFARLLMVMGALLALAGVVQAADRAKAKEAYARAMQHYDLAEYRDALEAFRNAYRHFEDPSILP